MIIWTAKYTDGSFTSQFDQAGNKVATYRDIYRDRLEAFVLHWPDGRPVAVVDFTDDRDGDPEVGPKRLIWRLRRMSSTNGAHVNVHLAGWQRQVAGRNVQSILYVNDETGVVVLGGQWVENIPMMGAIKPLEFEADLNN